MNYQNITFKEKFLIFDGPEIDKKAPIQTENVDKKKTPDTQKLSGDVVSNLTETPKSGTLHGEVISRLQKLEKDEKAPEKLAQDKDTLKKSNIADIRYSRVFNKDNETDPPATRIENTKAEMDRRLLAYTNKHDGDWFEIDYKNVGGMSHEFNIGLGDLLVDPDVTDILVEKKNGITIKAHRGVSEKGRVGFLDENNKYVATFTGDKFKILTNKEETPSVKEPAKYIEKLNTEKKAREENRITYQASLNYTQTSVYDILAKSEIPEFKNPEKLTNQEVIDKFQKMTATELLTVTNKVTSDGLRYLFKEIGIAFYSQKNKLIEQVNAQVDALKDDNSIVTAHEGKENLKKDLINIVAHECGFKPFNLSSTGCMGFFQFTQDNVKAFDINPFDPEQAVKGQLKLSEGNAKIIGNNTTRKEMIIANNRGAGFVSKNRANLDQVEKDEHGNPTPNDFYNSVMNQDLNQFSDDNLKIELAANITVLNPKSAPLEKSENGTTLCSKTAKLNLRMLGVQNVREGDAIDVQNTYVKDGSNRVTGGNNTEIVAALNSTDKKVADVFVESTSQFGHRAAAFKSATTGEWKILDPYFPPYTRDSIPMEKYGRKIIFAVPLNNSVA